VKISIDKVKKTTHKRNLGAGRGTAQRQRGREAANERRVFVCARYVIAVNLRTEGKESNALPV